MRPSSSVEHILLISPDTELRRTLCGFLERSGCCVLVQGSIESAFLTPGQSDYSLAIVDCRALDKNVRGEYLHWLCRRSPLIWLEDGDSHQTPGAMSLPRTSPPRVLLESIRRLV